MPRENDEFQTTIEDFERYRDKKQWEAAFRSLTKLAERESNGLVASTDGFFLPSKSRLRTMLMSLPTEARDAYRLFFDAAAKQSYDAAVQLSAASAAGDEPAADDVPLLSKVVDRYFLTRDGDQAADRLADALYERGDFAGAASLWRSTLSDYPDSDLPPLRLRTKLAAALSRLNDRSGFDELATVIRSEHAGESITVAGESITAAAYLDQLQNRFAAPLASTETKAATPILPATDAEAWQTVFANEAVQTYFREQLVSRGFGRYIEPIDRIIPPSVMDEHRVYVNWLGNVFAVDLSTGKLIWRSTKFADIIKENQQTIDYGFRSQVYTITLSGKDVLVTKPDGQRNGNQANVSITSIDGATGRVNWVSTSGPLTGYNFAGAPLVADGTIFAVATKTGATDFQLLAIEPDTRKIRWSAPLGTPAAGSTPHGQPKMPVPVLMFDNGTLYVLTNNAALLAVDTSRRSLSWALRLEGGPMFDDPNNRIFFGNQTQEVKIVAPPILMMRGGLLYAKEAESDRLYAIDAASMKIAWRRPLSSEEAVVGFDGDRMITLGQEIGAIDAKRSLLWSTRISTGTGDLRALLGGQRLIFMGDRGLYHVSTTNGDVLGLRRGADKGAVGGTVWRSGNRLITVSNQAVTAYDLPAGAAEATAPVAK